MELAARLSSVTGATTHLRQAATQAFNEFETAIGSRKLGISIDLVSLGRTSSLVSTQEKRASNVFNTYDPSNFRADDMSESVLGSDSVRFSRQQDNMRSVIGATVAALKGETPDVAHVATAQSFLAAFDNFISEAETDVRGLLHKVELKGYTEIEVLRALAMDFYGVDTPGEVEDGLE